MELRLPLCHASLSSTDRIALKRCAQLSPLYRNRALHSTTPISVLRIPQHPPFLMTRHRRAERERLRRSERERVCQTWGARDHLRAPLAELQLRPVLVHAFKLASPIAVPRIAHKARPQPSSSPPAVPETAQRTHEQAKARHGHTLCQYRTLAPAKRAGHLEVGPVALSDVRELLHLACPHTSAISVPRIAGHALKQPRLPPSAAHRLSHKEPESGVYPAFLSRAHPPSGPPSQGR
eukprot:893699-Rhodomonas_salina.2